MKKIWNCEWAMEINVAKEVSKKRRIVSISMKQSTKMVSGESGDCACEESSHAREGMKMTGACDGGAGGIGETWKHKELTVRKRRNERRGGKT